MYTAPVIARPPPVMKIIPAPSASEQLSSSRWSILAPVAFVTKTASALAISSNKYSHGLRSPYIQRNHLGHHIVYCCFLLPLPSKQSSLNPKQSLPLQSLWLLPTPAAPTAKAMIGPNQLLSSMQF